jgi:hypothetical protein
MRKEHKMKFWIVRLAAVIVVVAGAVGGPSAGSAAAYSQTNSRCPGTVQVPTTNGYNNPIGASFEFPQRVAWRSPCYSAYNQVINIRYRLWGYDPPTHQWVNFNSTWRTATAPPGYAVWLLGWGGGSPYANISADVLVEWRLTNGYLIGSSYLNYDAIGDYFCGVGAGMGPCHVYSDPTMGAYIHFG